MLSRTDLSVRDRVFAKPPPAAAADRDLVAARAIVAALDRYQLDPIIGFFVPGLGDIITTVVGAFLVTVAARRGVPPIVIARMLLNLAVDAAVGVVPIVGDVADIAIRANKKNLALLERRTGADRSSASGAAAGLRPDKSTWRDWAAVVGAAALVIGMFAVAVYVLYRVVAAIF